VAHLHAKALLRVHNQHVADEVLQIVAEKRKKEKKERGRQARNA
jgi:hypothetical protein